MPWVWAAFLLPATVWSGHLLVVYLAVSTLCPTGGTPAVRSAVAATTVAALAIIAGCFLYARREAEALDAPTWEDESPPPRSRTFMVRAAMYGSLLFFIATLFEAAPAFALHSC